jgi:hypothetical protein
MRHSEKIFLVRHLGMTPWGSNLGGLPGNAKAYHRTRGSFVAYY